MYASERAMTGEALAPRPVPPRRLQSSLSWSGGFLLRYHFPAPAAAPSAAAARALAPGWGGDREAGAGAPAAPNMDGGGRARTGEALAPGPGPPRRLQSSLSWSGGSITGYHFAARAAAPSAGAADGSAGRCGSSAEGQL